MMNKRNLKLIMELLFIFILPLVFICFTSEIQLEREFTYDNQGNYETSQDTKQLSFDNSIIKYTNTPLYINYLDFNQLIPNTINFYENGVTSIKNVNSQIIYSSGTYNGIIKLLNNIDLSKCKIVVYFESDTTNNKRVDVWNENYTVNKSININSSNYALIDCNYDLNHIMYRISGYETNEQVNIESKIQLFNLTQMYGNGFEPTLEEFLNIIPNNDYNYISSNIINYESENIISENYSINYTIWGNIKELLITNLDLNDNVLLNIVLCYTILWVIMWIIWHLFYGLFELLWHIIPSPIERRI